MSGDKGKYIAKVIVVGDQHLLDRNYGQHNDYPEESFEYFSLLPSIVRDEMATHLIIAGDFSYGRFRDLDYRLKVDKVFDVLNQQLGGNLYMVKGNHDKSTSGMTEFEYYLERKKFRPSEKLRIGSTELVMVDYGNEFTEQAKPTEDGHKSTIVIAHNWFTFNGSEVPSGARCISLTEHPYWFGVSAVLSGHIHEGYTLDGFIRNPGTDSVSKTKLWQLPCWARPQFNPNYPETGGVGPYGIINLYENGFSLSAGAIKLKDLKDSFNMSLVESVKQEKQSRADLKDIVQNLADFTQNSMFQSANGFASPEKAIMAMNDVDIKYREKAVELLRLATEK